MNRGVPPTALNARTGEFTPPGVTALARVNSSSEPVVFAVVLLVVLGGATLAEFTWPFSPSHPETANPAPATTA